MSMESKYFNLKNLVSLFTRSLYRSLVYGGLKSRRSHILSDLCPVHAGSLPLIRGNDK